MFLERISYTAASRRRTFSLLSKNHRTKALALIIRIHDTPIIISSLSRKQGDNFFYAESSNM